MLAWKRYICLAFMFFMIQLNVHGQKADPNSHIQKRSITVHELLETKFIEDLIIDFPKSDFIITHFSIGWAGKGVEYMYFDTSGNQLTLRMKEGIKKLRPGNSVFIESVKANHKDIPSWIKYFDADFIISSN